MQQISLFKEKENVIKRGSFSLKSKLLDEENLYIGTLSIPSWEFIIKYSLIDNKIDWFQIIDYTWYLYITVSIIKNIKNLVQVIISSEIK